jgi:hypothetical protein
MRCTTARRRNSAPQALAALTVKILGIDAWNRLMIACRITPPASEE